MLLIAGTAISIIVVSALADEIINMTLDKEAGITFNGQYFVNLLTAQDSHMQPIPDSELIQISRGYAVVLILGLVYSATIGPRQLYCGQFFKIIAIVGLIVGTCLELPQSFWESLASRQFTFEVPEGRQNSFIRTLFYSGFLIFSVGNLPITIPEISGENKATELPVYKATICAILTKVLFGVLGSHLIQNATQETIY